MRERSPRLHVSDEQSRAGTLRKGWTKVELEAGRRLGMSECL